MKCVFLLYGITWSYTIFICSALDLDALEMAGANTDLTKDGPMPAAGTKADKKGKLISELVKKVCNIANGALKLASRVEKTKLLTDIEERLRASTQVHEIDRDMYVELIMKGIRLMVHNADTSLCENADSQSHIMDYLKKSRRSNDEVIETNAKFDLRKQELANQVQTKMEYLINKALENATTDDEKQRLVAKVKAKVTSAFENKETLRGFVKTSLEKAIEKALGNNNNNTRRSLNDILTPKVVETPPEEEFDWDKVETLVRTTESGVVLTTRITCDDIKRDACRRLKQLNEFKCTYDDHTLPLRMVCDGSIDCADGTDEVHCEKQAAERITNSSDFIEHLKLNKECFDEIHTNSLLSRQGALLSGVLKTQLEFIQKYTINNDDPKFRAAEDYRLSADQIAKELLLITKTFNLAMSGAICMDPQGEADQFIRDTGRKLDWELEQIEKQMKISPKTCVCLGKSCYSANCTSPCKRVCYQKYSLVRFACKAVSGDASVSLNEVCDGKFDCFDESDETGCVSVSENNDAHRFEASKLYSDLLNMIQTKFTSKEFEPIWNQLRTLHKFIQQVQKNSIRQHVSEDTFAIIRNGCFDWIVNSFMDLLDSDRNVEAGEDAYEFFISVNEKLIRAMKLSRTGNKKLMSDNECFCRGIQCVIPHCSKHCKLHCAVKPALTTYACGNVMARNNTYVDIDYICNGKANCPKGEDEVDCKSKEICRSLHLMVLRHNIMKLDDRKYHGTILGDVFKDWRTKVTSSLLIAEKAGRPTPMDIKTLIRTILDDLVTAYVTMYDQRKVAKPAALHAVYKKFEKLAQKIIDTVKSCGK